MADFEDKEVIKKVKLDLVCRQQQVHDKCFDTLDEVPEYALTVTVPRLMASQYIFCIVPSDKKHDATVAALTGPCEHGLPGQHPAPYGQCAYVHR